MIEKKNGKSIDTIEPRKGIKFKKNAKIPNVGARLFSIKNKIKNVKTPVKKLESVFNLK